MLNKHLSWLLVILLLLLPIARPASAKPQTGKGLPSGDQIKVQVAGLGIGAKARAIITLKSGAKTKGYVSQAGEDDFVIRDRKTGSPTTIRYAEVVELKPDRGHSTATNLVRIIGISVGAFFLFAGIMSHAGGS